MDSQGNGTIVSIPLTHHRVSLEYIKNRIIASFVRLPVRILIAFSYYLIHGPWFLRRTFNVTRTRINVPSRQRGRTIRADLYIPDVLVKDAQGRSPVHVNWHGSGFVLDCFGADGEMCAYLANKMRCFVIDADYRKAPEYPFPCGVHDAEDLTAFVLSGGVGKNIDVNKVTVGGSSAGACLSLVVGVLFGRRLKAVACIAPPTDFRPQSRPKVPPELGHPRALPRSVTLWFDSCYLVPTADRADPRLSPACARMEHDQLTCNVVYIATGMGDTLHQDAERLVRSLDEQGHPCAVLRSVKGEGHAFEKAMFGARRVKALAVLDEIVSLVTRSWSSSPSDTAAAAAAAKKQKSFL